MLWEQFRSLALPLLGEHFPPELIENNGDSIVFTDRRSWASYLLTRLREESSLPTRVNETQWSRST